MKEPPSSEKIGEAATELAVHLSFVEKDWYAIQALTLVARHDNENTLVTFSGGTSLSKGFGLIKRFSEDLDFIIDPNNFERTDRRAYRQSIIETIQSDDAFEIQQATVKSRNDSKFFSFNINYTQTQENHSSIRPYLKLEMSFRELSLPAENRPVSSFISELGKSEPEVEILCVEPTETAADKLSALVWRVLIKNREQESGSKWNEPEMIRHLHDLCALEQRIKTSDRFSQIAQAKFLGDAQRGGFRKKLTLKEAAIEALKRIEEDQVYPTEYENFVDAMSYAADDERIEFNTALSSLRNIINLLD